MAKSSDHEPRYQQQYDEADDGDHGTSDAATFDEEQEGQAGRGDNDQQNGDNIDHQRPRASGVASFVEIIQDSHETFGGFGDVIGCGFAVDKDIGAVAGAFEGERAIIIL